MPDKIKIWNKYVNIEDNAMKQIQNVASMPFIHKHVAVMPDAHWGMGCTVGSVIATTSAIIPAAVGVDIGCGMIAEHTSIRASQLPDNLFYLRAEIEKAIPHGRSHNGREGDIGAHKDPKTIPLWTDCLEPELKKIQYNHPKIKGNALNHLGTLGTGNHFIELCLDENNIVWIMLHSGSRGIGNAIGNYFITLAKEQMIEDGVMLADMDLAYLQDNKDLTAYCNAVFWAQEFAKANRLIMMEEVKKVLTRVVGNFYSLSGAINCHHNYISRELHYNKECFITRKGAISAQKGQLGIIPGSMGTKSFVVRGLGNPESFNSCSHGAGRVMSRGAAKKLITLEQHAKATEGVECRKDTSVLDESPAAYKDIDNVMRSQEDLVEIVHTLKQVLCVKG